jgi:hypothetical protein
VEQWPVNGQLCSTPNITIQTTPVCTSTDAEFQTVTLQLSAKAHDAAVKLIKSLFRGLGLDESVVDEVRCNWFCLPVHVAGILQSPFDLQHGNQQAPMHAGDGV